VTTDSLEHVREEIVVCRKCPRLVEWREEAARRKPRRFAEWDYWARPVPGFGDPDACVLVVGLAPAADGGNRTGRIFTGDPSGDFLYASLHRARFANQPTSVSRDDGLRLRDAYVAAVNRCAPPDNKPKPDERARCLPYLVRELQLLPRARVIVPLGRYAWDGVLLTLEALGLDVRPKPKFGHGVEVTIGPYELLGSFHPSPHNTYTGKLTPAMLDEVFERARALADC
jgi:uracil-DNA glycosylase family 4